MATQTHIRHGSILLGIFQPNYNYFCNQWTTITWWTTVVNYHYSNCF